MENIKKICKSIYLPFIVFGIILILVHIPFTKFGDDIWFQNILNDKGLIQYTVDRYNGWTSRNIIETALVILSNTHVSMTIWKIMNVCMFLLLAYSTYTLFIKSVQDNDKKLKLTWFLIMSIFLIPYSAIKEVGWIATTANYLWVLAIRNVFNNTYKEKY